MSESLNGPDLDYVSNELNSSFEAEIHNSECFLHCPDVNCIINDVADENFTPIERYKKKSHSNSDHNQLPQLIITDDDFMFNEAAREVINFFFSLELLSLKFFVHVFFRNQQLLKEQK